ncbi:unnamed protein product [Xylocopa violacea]|uniref:Chitin-binding type-2 domain-containing protein n=1 Tax=Xylocopa violacea TaxID=135666 RepID=A0ABP1NXA6_XYLVO
MKPSIVVALAAVLVASVSASDLPRCPDIDEDDVILLPNPDDCTKYYVCDEGQPILMNCSKGLIFDPKQKVCTWGDVKTCVVRPDHTKTSTTPSTTSTVPNDSPTTSEEDETDAELREHSRPPRPSRPTEGPRPSRPPRPTEEPRPPRPSRPTEGPRPSRSPRPTASAENAVQCPPHNRGEVILLPKEDDCTAFYSCNEGTPFLMKCGEGLVFDSEKQACDWGDVQCKSHPTETTPPPTTAPPSQPEPSRTIRPSQNQVHCPEHNRGEVILLPKEDDCTAFYSCNEGTPILMKCGEGLVFDSEKQACDWGDVQCKSHPTGTTLPPTTPRSSQPEPSRTIRPSQNQVHCPEHNRGEVVLLPKEDDCTAFYSCNEGTPILMKCGEGLVFDSEKQACDWGDVQCKSHPTGTTLPPTTAPPSQPEPSRTIRPSQNQVHCPEHNRGEVILLPKEDDCTAFYSCNEGTPILMKCGEGLVFDSEKQACDWGDVQCKSHPTGTTLPPTTAPTSQPEPSRTIRPSQNQVHCPEHNRGEVVLLPKEDDCTAFYSCNEGTPILMKCGEGLVFDSEKQACDWGDVQCKSHPTGTTLPPTTAPPSQPEPSRTIRPSQNQVHCPEHNRGEVILLPKEDDCTAFYSCNEGTPILMKCGEGLVFDSEKQACDWGDVQCKSHPTGTTLPPTTAPPSQPEPSRTIRPSENQVHCPEHNRGEVILLPKEDDCTAFYSCNEGTPILMKCGEGLVFDSDKQVCYRGNVQCKNRPTTPSHILPKCPPHNDVDVSLLPNPDDPTTFYSCVEGVPILMHCGDGLIFDPRDRVCEYSGLSSKHGSTESSHSHDHHNHHNHHTRTSTSTTAASTSISTKLIFQEPSGQKSTLLISL